MTAPRVTSTRVVYENRWLRLHEDRLERPDGSPGLYAWIEKPPAAVIVPLEDDHVWLIEQHRHPVGRRFWELPQGSWEDSPDAPAEELARGELAEETGLRARELEPFGSLFCAYGMSDQRFDVWLARGLEPGDPPPQANRDGLRSAGFALGELEAMSRRAEVG